MIAQRWRRPGVALLLAILMGMATAAPGDAMSTGQATLHTATPVDVPVSLFIPRIDLETPVVPTGWQEGRGERVWDVPADAAGWHLGSARVGESNNLVLSGHNNIRGSVFRDLGELAVGDTLVIRTKGGARRYSVTARLILREIMLSVEQREENARWIGAFPDERVTLITCYPAWTNTHRLIVVAEPAQSVSRNWLQGLVDE